jgi:hypothetical protein
MTQDEHDEMWKQAFLVAFVESCRCVMQRNEGMSGPAAGLMAAEAADGAMVFVRQRIPLRLNPPKAKTPDVEDATTRKARRRNDDGEIEDPTIEDTREARWRDHDGDPVTAVIAGDGTLMIATGRPKRLWVELTADQADEFEAFIRQRREPPKKDA